MCRRIELNYIAQSLLRVTLTHSLIQTRLEKSMMNHGFPYCPSTCADLSFLALSALISPIYVLFSPTTLFLMQEQIVINNRNFYVRSNVFIHTTPKSVKYKLQSELEVKF